MKNISKQK